MQAIANNCKLEEIEQDVETLGRTSEEGTKIKNVETPSRTHKEETLGRQENAIGNKKKDD